MCASIDAFRRSQFRLKKESHTRFLFRIVYGGVELGGGAVGAGAGADADGPMAHGPTANSVLLLQPLQPHFAFDFSAPVYPRTPVL